MVSMKRKQEWSVHPMFNKYGSNTDPQSVESWLTPISRSLEPFANVIKPHLENIIDWIGGTVEDLHTHAQARNKGTLDALTCGGFQALAVHRFGKWRRTIKSRALRLPLSATYRIAEKIVIAAHGIELPDTAHIGRWVTIEHQNGIVIHGNAVIGDACVIRQGCTVGACERDGWDRAPVLEAGVQLGANSVVVGKITVGPRIRIGANRTVAHSIAYKG